MYLQVALTHCNQLPIVAAIASRMDSFSESVPCVTAALLHLDRSCCLGRALDKAINSDEKPASKELYTLRAEQLKLLNWHHWHRAEIARIKNYFPTAYPLF